MSALLYIECKHCVYIWLHRMKHSIEVALTRIDKLHATECLHYYTLNANIACTLCSCDGMSALLCIECKHRVYIGLHRMKHSIAVALTRIDKLHATECQHYYALYANIECTLGYTE